MFHLSRLSVRGFRGFTHQRDFEFDQPLVILAGENHRGKSSTLNAVEWCLFGDDCTGKKSGIPERLNWEVANRYAPESGAAVEAHFVGADGAYVVRREASGSRRRAAGHLTIVTPDGTQIEGEDAEQRLGLLFRSSFRDFMTTTYQHQETVRAILTDAAKERNDAIDRLLGLSVYRELLRGIRAADVEKAQRNMDAAFEELRLRAEQSIRTYEKEVREQEQEAARQGIRAEEMTEQEVLRRAREVAEAVQSLARDLEIVGFEVEPPARYEELPRFREWVKTQTDSLWSRAPDVERQEELARQQRDVATLKGRYEAARDGEVDARQARDSFVRQHGDSAALATRIAGAKKRIAELDAQMRELNRRASLVREAIDYLKPSTAQALLDQRCPLCGSQSPRLLEHLTKEWQDTIKGQVDHLEHQRHVEAFQLDGLESQAAQLDRLERAAEQAALDLAAWLSQVSAALGRPVVAGDDPGALLAARLRQVEAEIQRIAQAIEQKRQRISGSGGIYDQLARLRTVDEIIKYDRKRDVVERIWQTPEFAQLDELRDQAARLVEDVGVMRSCLAAVSRQEAGEKISAAGASLSEYFKRMANHPAITGLSIEVSEDSRSGLNSYVFKDQNGSDPTPILSQGDFNCLALSLFLGLARATSDGQSFAFIMMDDPAQSLGPEAKRRLVAVLDDVASWRRLFVATPDDELRELLTSNITKSKAVYTFVDWTEENGPTVLKMP